MIYNAKKLRQSVFSLIIRRNSHMSIYLISFYQFKRSVMSNKDCFSRLLQQLVIESGKVGPKQSQLQKPTYGVAVV